MLFYAFLSDMPALAGEATYTNPVIDELGSADPDVILHNGTYYLYCTGDNVSYRVYTSPDLVNWTKKGRVFKPGHGCVVTDAKGALWHVYHQQRDESRGWHRFLCLDPLWFDAAGVLHGKATRGTPQQAPAIGKGVP